MVWAAQGQDGDAEFAVKASRQFLRFIFAVEIADAGMVTSDDEMRAAIVAPDDGVKHRLARAGIAHHCREHRKHDPLLRQEAPDQGLIAGHHRLGAIVADLLAGQPVLRSLSDESAWLGLLGIIVTAISLAGLLMRPEKKYLRMAPGSIVILITYLFWVVGLLFIR